LILLKDGKREFLSKPIMKSLLLGIAIISQKSSYILTFLPTLVYLLN